MESINNLSIGCYRTGSIHNRQIVKDNKTIYRATEAINNLGAYIIGNKLYDSGRLVAVSALQHPQLTMINEKAYFGEVRLSTYNIVINITLDNYNKLYNREEVPGYKYFDPYDVYRIVGDVSNAETIVYERYDNYLLFTIPGTNKKIEWPNTAYVLYNNVVGESAHNAESEEVTVKQYNAPYLCPHYFNPRILPNGTVSVPFNVDNYFADYVQGRTVNGKCRQAVTGPYTIEIRNQDLDDANHLVRKTVYAGESIIESKPFTLIGENWFTLRCIDENGCGSPVHYMVVLVEDPDYHEALWEVDDNELRTRHIAFDDNFNSENDPHFVDGENREEYDAFVVQAYKNKLALNKLFEDALDPLISGGNYNGVSLPKHRYYICEYTKVSGTDENPILNNDHPRYYYCEITATSTSNSIVSIEQCNEEQVIADSKSIYRKANDANAVDYNALRTYTPYGLVGDSYQKLSVLTQNTTNIYYYNSDQSKYVLYGTGKYYFVVRNTENIKPAHGTPLTCPSHFTLDLNDSTIRTIHQYDFSPPSSLPEVRAFELAARDQVVIRNGRFDFGIANYDWVRCCVRMASTNPLEHASPIGQRGYHFCKFINVTFEGFLGYGISGNPQVSRTWVTVDQNKAYTSNGKGLYDNKRLDFKTGLIEDAYDDLETLVMSDTSIPYGSVSSNEDIGYIPINLTRDTADTKYIFIGYTGNGITAKGKRHEMFAFFYKDVVNDGVTETKLVKVVKTCGVWMIRVPEGATKMRIMAYAHSGKGNISNGANWYYIGVYPARSSYGAEYRGCTIKNARAAIVAGNETQVLFDDFDFIDGSSPEVYKPTGSGTWGSITPHCIDLESGAPFGKYVTFNNVRTSLTPGRSGCRSICVQAAEFVLITNCDALFVDYGLNSGLIKDNVFKNDSFIAEARAAHVAPYWRSGVIFHKHVLYENNVFQSRVTDGSYILWHTFGTDGYNMSDRESLYGDTAEWWLPLRLTTFSGWEKTQEHYDKITWRNSKRINRRIGYSREKADDIYVD